MQELIFSFHFVDARDSTKDLRLSSRLVFHTETSPQHPPFLNMRKDIPLQSILMGLWNMLRLCWQDFTR